MSAGFIPDWSFNKTIKFALGTGAYLELLASSWNPGKREITITPDT